MPDGNLNPVYCEGCRQIILLLCENVEKSHWLEQLATIHCLFVLTLSNVANIYWKSAGKYFKESCVE